MASKKEKNILNVPLPLVQTTEHTGYRIRFNVRRNGETAEKTFLFVVLSVLKWVREKTSAKDENGNSVFDAPEPEDYKTADFSALRDVSISGGYIIRAVFDCETKTWALYIREPDQGTPDRDPEIGRFFCTNFSVSCKNDGVEFVCIINIDEPTNVKRTPYAFRPVPIRRLFETDGLILEQYKGDVGLTQKPTVIDATSFKKFRSTVESRDNSLCVVAITHTAPDLRAFDNFVHNPGLRIGMPVPPSVSAFVPKPAIDADVFAKHGFGLVRTFLITPDASDKFAEYIKTKRVMVADGDVFVIPPLSSGGMVKRFSSNEVSAAKFFSVSGDHSTGTFIEYCRACPANNGAKNENILFAEELFRKKLESDFEKRIKNFDGPEFEELRRAYNELKESKSKIEKEYQNRIKELEGVVADKENEVKAEYDRAYNELFSEIDRTEKLLAEHNNDQLRLKQLEGVEEERKKLSGAVDFRLEEKTLPETPEAVIGHFKRVFGDRIEFIDDVLDECKLEPKRLWEILFVIATDMWELYTGAPGANVWEEIRKKHNMDFHGLGEMTRKDAKLMAYYVKEYDGKTIEIESHTTEKVENGKGRNSVHYAYLPEKKKILVAHIGRHLPTYEWKVNPDLK